MWRRPPTSALRGHGPRPPTYPGPSAGRAQSRPLAGTPLPRRPRRGGRRVRRQGAPRAGAAAPAPTARRGAGPGRRSARRRRRRRSPPWVPGGPRLPKREVGPSPRRPLRRGDPAAPEQQDLAVSRLPSRASERDLGGLVPRGDGAAPSLPPSLSAGGAGRGRGCGRRDPAEGAGLQVNARGRGGGCGEGPGPLRRRRPFSRSPAAVRHPVGSSLHTCPLRRAGERGAGAEGGRRAARPCLGPGRRCLCARRAVRWWPEEALGAVSGENLCGSRPGSSGLEAAGGRGKRPKGRLSCSFRGSSCTCTAVSGFELSLHRRAKKKLWKRKKCNSFVHAET